VGNDQKPPGSRGAERDEAVLAERVIWISGGRRQRIAEDGRRLLERDAVLGEI
jgi:hypothetical protein